MESSHLRKTTCSKQLLIFLFCQFVASFCLFSFFRGPRGQRMNLQSTLKSPPVSVNTTEVVLDYVKEETYKLVILLWTWPFHHPFPLESCPPLHGNHDCHFTANRSWLLSADAVIVHHRDVQGNPRQLTQIRRDPSQRWVWFNLESPSNSRNLGAMDNLFNMTMSYRSDSDFFTPYGSLEPQDEPENFTIPPKSKMVAWAVSNWNPSSRRVQYYEELKKHLQVDVFGRQHKPLPRSQLLSTLSQYRFYLAFENSQHQDYITEKLWHNALASGTVPVVLGPSRKNYERFLPSEAFIHIDDFPSAQALAQHLHNVTGDEARYREYFQWRNHFRVMHKFSWINHYCKACQGLYESTAYRTVPCLAQWFQESYH
ncbi:3-galactosyl-N-acetylglucosaminide 4-alpha-L-fucosyltransferase FUT3-like [Tachyglossus aculeatus]|uniref:3-galactosyl-N-acetylglucosaminide 4-alpha-L-fucosyltransferase FUT3-like n=1 Tax=Tachyglossus aculeatus TaxID=9261 RepID=UPI0018F3262D|nr:3-galactosyl-N-acetylglucosaminide 4-alpha-L-fucosyltransferase FUT3-like [Tachyglossus aculeatus]